MSGVSAGQIAPIPEVAAHRRAARGGRDINEGRGPGAPATARGLDPGLFSGAPCVRSDGAPEQATVTTSATATMLRWCISPR
ncbi:MAG: hypothetical protein H0W21_13300 [Actinobacteria bacterium]|nr:hypothetical protein [Actinomycetota bacterium]